MMTVTSITSGRTFVVAFMHSSPWGIDPTTGEHKVMTRRTAGASRRQLDADTQAVGRRVTVCQIAEIRTDSDEFYGIGTGIAQCHPDDQFNKAVGRKKSFTYALEAASSDNLLTRAERRDLWVGYFNTFESVPTADGRTTVQYR